MGRNAYWPSLDGVRGVAIAAVIAFHLGFLGGGWLGVDLFFVLSGFLITSLLVAERDRHGGISLTAFWARRAKRLAPALLVMLAGLALYAWAGGSAVVPAQLRTPALSTLFYAANWQQIANGHAYFSHFQAVSPLQHTWSLSIEEQYYLVWPLLVLAVSQVARRRLTPVLGAVAAFLALASATWMGIAAHVLGANRAYLGTDARAWELLVGGLGALALHRAPPLRRRGAWRGATLVGAAVVAVGIAAASGPPGWIWDGGLVAIALGALAVITGSVRDPEGPVARVLSWRPLAWLGRISYSLYLWHWPVIVVLNAQTIGERGAPLLVLRLVAMVSAAAVSYYVVERPLRSADWRAWWRRALAPVSVAGVIGLVMASTVPPVLAASGTVRRLPVTSPVHSVVSTPPPPIEMGRVATSADPYRMWILGDSVMADSAPGVTAALEATGDVRVVADSAYGGWGLSTDTTFATDAAQIIARYHPEIVLGTWSWDDVLASLNPKAYLEKLQGALDELLAPGTGVQLVVLLQFPQLGPNPYNPDPTTRYAAWAEQNREQIEWNDIVEQVVGSFPGHALYLKTQQLFAPGNRYLTWNKTADGAWIRARKVDNLHMCPFGAAEFGSLIENDLAPVLTLSAPQPGWDLGAWVHDANYNDPPGACPDDKPPQGYTGVAVPGPPS